MDERYDVIIVGGGPGGLAAAIYAGRSELKTLVIEKGGYGGRIKETAEIKNYPGTILDSGTNLMLKFKQHAESYDTISFKRTTVTAVSTDDGGVVVDTKRRGSFYGKLLIVDTGTEPRTLGIPGEKEFVGKGVSYCATCDAEFFKGQEIHVLGAGDQAIEEANYLTRFASKVNIIVLHEEGHLDCNEASARRAMKNPKINFIWNATLDKIEGTDHVEKVVIKNVQTNELTEEKSKGVFFFIGMTPKTDIVRELVDCDEKGFILVNEQQETSVPGIYAVGDCTNTFLRQVVTAAADGARAIVSGERYLTEKEELDELLKPESGAVAFVFYDPYSSRDIEVAATFEQQLAPSYKVYKQDVSRQRLLYRKLAIQQTVSAALYQSGELDKILTEEELSV